MYGFSISMRRTILDIFPSFFICEFLDRSCDKSYTLAKKFAKSYTLALKKFQIILSLLSTMLACLEQEKGNRYLKVTLSSLLLMADR